MRKKKNHHEPDSHTLFDICGCYAIRQSNDKLGDLLDVDDILVLLISPFLALVSTKRIDGFGRCFLFRVHRNNLCAPSHLERPFFAYSLSVRRDIP